nr:MAG: L2 protein [Neophocaena asiaeorientalis asiaeorientalis papillomavirus 4]
MVRAKRTKRAGESTLYAGCLAGQDCPEDIKRKFEQDTWADRFLKWISSFVYLGNLGISTGRGSGGSTGYVPIGGGRGGTGMGARPSRPSVVVETVGPTDIAVSGGGVDASTPSVITPTGSSVVVEGAPTANEEIPLLPVHPDIPHINPENGVVDPSLHLLPGVDSGGPAILDVTFDVSPSVIARPEPDSLFPTFQLQPLDVSLLPGESSFVPGTLVNSSGNFEEIELGVLGGSGSYTEPPTSSTPVSRSEGALSAVKGAYNRRTGALRRYYHRLTQQVRVQRPDFLQRPEKLVTYDFDNAAFDPEESLLFPQAPDSVVRAPDIDFQDVASLGRPVYSIDGGHVRVSRFGVRQTIRTSVGTAIGARVHFFTDISSIQQLPEDTALSLGLDDAHSSMELQLLGESTGDTTFADGQGGGYVLHAGEPHTAETSMSVIDGSLHSEYSDSMLLDTYSDTFGHGHLALMGRRGPSDIVSVPDFSRPLRNFAESVGGLYVENPTFSNGKSRRPSIPFINSTPLTPIIYMSYAGGGPSYFLHPSLLRRKRKRVFY